jgi:hypothetical protein
MRVVRKHNGCKWVELYIERWLTAPLQTADGTLVERHKGTPQGGVITPSHDVAKLPFDLAVTIPRDRLRPHYRDGFSGAPLMLCRPSKARWPDHGGADATARDKPPDPQSPGEP